MFLEVNLINNMATQSIDTGQDRARFRKLKKLKAGDKIVTIEFECTAGVPDFNVKEYEFVKYIEKNVHIEGIEQDEGAIKAELKSPDHKKIQVKTNIAEGFFFTAEEAAIAMVKSLKWMYESAEKILHEKYHVMIDGQPLALDAPAS